MYPSLPDTADDPWTAPQAVIEKERSTSRYSYEDPTGPIPVFVETDRSVRPRKRTGPLLTAVFIFVLVMAIGILGHWLWTGNWNLPGFDEQTQSSVVSTPSAAAPSSAVPAPLPPPVADPHDPVSQDVPTFITIRRGQTQLISAPIAGSYIPSGSAVDPPTDIPYWIGTSSKVGTGMTIPAVIVGHAQQNNDAMPFTSLGGVQQGDMIDVTVPAGIVTFVVDDHASPDKGSMGFGPENDVLKVISCVLPLGGQNVLLSAHLVSSKAA